MDDALRRRRVLAVIAGAFPALDTAVNVAFPAIDQHFSLAVADLRWIVITYLLTYGALLVGAGRIGDSIGYRRLVWWGSAISVLSLAACAAAPEFSLFLIARVGQGVGAALVLAGAPALLTTSALGSKTLGRGQAVGIFQAATMLGFTVGPAVGGPLVEFLGWRAVFWCRIPIALALLVLAHGLDEPEVAPAETANDRIDYVEMMLGVAAIAAVVAVASLGGIWGWADLRLASLAFVAVGLAFVLVRRNQTTHAPMVDPRLWRRPGFMQANVLSLIANGAAFPVWLLVPSLLVDEASLAVIASGFILAVSPAMSSLSSSWVGRRVDGGNPDSLVAAGLVGQACGMAMLGVVGPSGSVLLIGVGLACVGLGLGIFLVPNMHQVMASLPVERQGVAGGLSLMMRTVGIVVAVAVSSAIFEPVEQSNGFDAGFRVVFLICAAVLALAAALSSGGKMARNQRAVYKPERNQV